MARPRRAGRAPLGWVLALGLGACPGRSSRSAPGRGDDAAITPVAVTAAAAVAPAAIASFVDARLATLPPELRPPSRRPDRRVVWGRFGGVVAFPRRDPDGKVRVVVNDQASRYQFDHVTNLELGPDGGTPRYVGNDGGRPTDVIDSVAGGADVLVVGDQRGLPHPQVLPLHATPHDVVLEADDAPRGRRERLVVDGRPGPWLDEVEFSTLAWLPDGTPTYRATLDRARRVVLGDDVGPGFEFASAPHTAARAPVVAYAAGTRAEAYLFTGRTRGARHDAIGGGRVGPDGTVAYEATRGADRFAVIGDRELGPYRRADAFTFAPNGRVAFSAGQLDDRWVVVVDGRADPPVAGVRDLTISPDGGHVAYAAFVDPPTRRRQVLVLDGRVISAPVAALSQLTWSRDGAHLAAVAQTDLRQAQVLLDGQPGPIYDQAGSPQFDAVGALIYEAKRGPAWCIVRAATELCHDDVGEPGMIAGTDAFNFVLDPSGRHLAYAARIGDRWTVVLDGTAGPLADMVWSPVFSPDGAAVGWGARLGDELWWKVMPVR